MKNKKMCQSCGMPLRLESDFGTNKNNTKNEDYCFHCFLDGQFTDGDITLKEKIDKNVNFAVEMGMDEKEARELAESVLPRLKRWKK